MIVASEQELARSVVDWLRDQHWTVYQEVTTGVLGARADIVATQDGLSWIIETKTSVSLSLLAQASNWIGCANFVSVAIPSRRRRGPSYEFARRILRERGIGLFEIRELGYVSDVAPRKFRRLISRSITDFLCEEQKTIGEAGSARGGYVTRFALTCRAVRAFVADNAGCTMRELIDGIEHHYASDSVARSCLRMWIGTDKISGVEQREDGRTWRIFPEREE